MISIGHRYIYNNKIVHCQDVNNLTLKALVGIPDQNNIVWETFWVDLSKLKEVENV